MENITIGPAGGAGGNIKDATDQSFMADVIEASKEAPVLVDFWAPWCGPCKSLTPVLEKVVNEQQGKVKLVKVNIDENPGVAGQLGVRSIPAVFAFENGRPVDAFQGALPEGQLKQFVEKLLGGTDEGQQIQEAIEHADKLLQSGDAGQAAQIYSAIIERDQKNIAAIAGLARCYLANDDPDRAAQILDMAGPDRQMDPAIKSVRTAIELMADAPKDSELDELMEKVTNDRSNHALRFELAEALMARGKNKEAADHLLRILSDDLNWEEGKAKAKLLELFEAAGPKDPATIEGRRRLSSLMFA
ncbi:thioredoxin [Henriciella sp.]|jgi:putative thioredoxin|uniref:thioredoxin n=1 Tax=Henriciella sp. TaxID=1968823 RepID=UPI0025BA93FB|nr:thioredoxin [Henriciella sp.]|tara:strand:- start:196 stop:1104 length:909 start_codon:yes stop_codon:yes gene_type:complete